MFGRVIYDKENIYLNRFRVQGVESFDAEIGFPYKPITVIGSGCIGQMIDGEITKTFSFSMPTNNRETDIINLVDRDITGVFKYQSSTNQTTGNWSSLNSRLSSYELTCAVGDIPKSKFSFEGLGDAGTYGDGIPVYDTSFDGFSIARPGDMVFSGNNFFVSNRLQSLTYGFSVPFKKNNFIGSEFSSVPTYSEPIQMTVKMDFELDDAESGVMTNALCEDDFNGYFTLSKCGTVVRTFNISGAKLTSSSINGSVGPGATFSCSYQSYVNDFETLKDFVIPEYIYPRYIVLTGAGSQDVNGIYSYNGLFQSAPTYINENRLTDIKRMSSYWGIKPTGGTIYPQSYYGIPYTGLPVATVPWGASNFTSVTGTLPLPTFILQ